MNVFKVRGWLPQTQAEATRPLKAQAGTNLTSLPLLSIGQGRIPGHRDSTRGETDPTSRWVEQHTLMENLMVPISGHLSGGCLPQMCFTRDPSKVK